MRLKIKLALRRKRKAQTQIWTKKRNNLGVYSRRNESSSKENVKMEWPELFYTGRAR
jgi:hypothetical protein